MPIPLQITFRHLKPAETLRALIREKAAKLDTFANHIIRCRVVIEPSGIFYQVRLDIKVPGEAIVATPNHLAEYRDLPSALRDAFDAAARQLQDYVQRKRGFVKTLTSPPHGRVNTLFPDEGFGFLTTPEGRDIFFHKHSVLNDDFDRLQKGTEVTFAEEDGDEGPQASTVKIVGGHRNV